jgi:aryl-alcohol dehydrogenase-like predicted oxidoreductase
VLANIIGATTLQQLEENIDSINVELSAELLVKINDIHARIPNPAP